MSDKDKVIEAFKNSEEPLNAKKVSELSGVVSPKRCYWTLADK